MHAHPRLQLLEDGLLNAYKAALLCCCCCCCTVIGKRARTTLCKERFAHELEVLVVHLIPMHALHLADSLAQRLARIDRENGVQLLPHEDAVHHVVFNLALPERGVVDHVLPHA